MRQIKDPKELQELAHKYKAGTITEEEKIIFDNWFNEPSSKPLIINNHDRGSNAKHRKLIFDKITDEIDQSSSGKSIKEIWRYLSLASAITLVIGLGAWYFLKTNPTPGNVTTLSHELSATAIETPTSYLKLSDGTSIDLENVDSGEMLKTKDIEISKSKDGLISYKILKQKNKDTPTYYELQTGVGEKFQILLADGTKVWLNTQTKLRFPSNFENQNTRKVFLIGEAFFEVEKKLDQPFLVHSENQVVEVLGTRFNVSKYGDDKIMKTTLVEGLVKINNHTIIKANQQALSIDDQIRVKSVNVLNYIDWVEGIFTFENENIIEVMRKVSRWYDLDVTFSSTDILKQTFTGSFSRSTNIDNVIKVLEETSDLNFRREQNKVIVTKKTP